jgi:hypothetical protein
MPGQIMPPLTAPAVLPEHIGYVPAQSPKLKSRPAPVRQAKIPKTKKQIMKQVWSEKTANPYGNPENPRVDRPLPDYHGPTQVWSESKANPYADRPNGPLPDAVPVPTVTPQAVTAPAAPTATPPTKPIKPDPFF